MSKSKKPKKLSGAQRLTAWIDTQRKSENKIPGWKFSLSALARHLKVSATTLRFWMVGKTQPEGAHRTTLARATRGRVAARHWK